MEELYKYFKEKLESKINSYPKTHSECCKILGIGSHIEVGFIDANYNIYDEYDLPDYNVGQLTLLNAYKKLIDCRNAYWKIIGEEMGLGKPWEPSENDRVAAICGLGNKVTTPFHYGAVSLLEFPTEEIRDIFYENFKTLIETCVYFI